MKKIINYLMTLLLLNFNSCAQNQKKIKYNENDDKSNKVQLTDEQWKSKLTSEQYYILRQKGTEEAFSGEFVFNKEKGIYKCAGCGENLFTDEMKFESNCGWPSFDKEITGGKIVKSEDNSHGMNRIEIKCAKCGGHLGHIFNDGPTETGMRYCVNSAALTFEPINKSYEENNTIQTITLGGGCFWCMEAVFEKLKGVQKVESGYSGGTKENPIYKEVCTGQTNYAEVVQITFNTNEIKLEDLLEVFFSLHDPTTLNRQGADIGTQYRSVIFYHNESQMQVAKKIIDVLNSSDFFEKPIVTELTNFNKFYKAENYHQEYYELNKEQPYCKAVIKPKLDKLHEIFNEKIKSNE